jgi:ABC-type bacteriocin/lantibiotic exporter with double-glycine peptidase domain
MAHLKATVSSPLLVKRTDELVHAYVATRKTRSDILHRQYKGAMVWQAVGHSGLIGVAGWLLSIGQITLGQFVASEVVVGTLLMSFDLVAKRLYALYLVFTSLDELAFVFSLPRDAASTKVSVPLPDPTLHGIRLTCHNVSFTYPNAEAPIFKDFSMEVAPGEKVAIFSSSSTGKTTLCRMLAGLYTPTAGVVRYNGVDLRDLDMDSINSCRGLVLDSQLSLIDATLEENITLGRPSVSYEDLRWAVRFVEMEEEVDALPMGLKTRVRGPGRGFSTGQMLRILVARAVITRPQIVILDGTLHSMQPTTREVILRRLCSKEEPWSVVFVSNDPTLKAHVDRRLVLE